MNTGVRQTQSPCCSFLGVAVIALTILVGLSVSREPRFSPDSIHYLDISKTFANEHRIATYHLTLNSKQIPDPALLWPPVYPILLAFPQMLGLDELQSVRAVTIFSILIIVFAGTAIFRLLAPHAPPHLFALILLYAITHIEVFKLAWSEPPFIALVMIFLLCCAKHIWDGRLLWLVLAGAVAAIAFLTRYIGIALLPVGMLAVLQRQHIEGRIRRPFGLIRLLSFAAGFVMLSAPWLLRNMLIIGHPMGPGRPSAITGLIGNFRLVAITLRNDVPLTLAVLLIGFMALIKDRRSLRSFLQSRPFHIVFNVLVYFVGYSVAQVLLSTMYRFDEIGTRLLSPLYPPLILLAAYTIDGLFSREVANTQPMYSRCAAVFITAIFISYLPLSPSGWKYHVLGAPSPAIPQNVDQWILDNTDGRTLIVGNEAWQRRFRTGRTVLQSGYPEMPVLTEEGILAFMKKFDSHISAAYLVCNAGDSLDQIMKKSPIVYSGTDGVVVRHLCRIKP